jgi:hypothetical protein
MPEKVKKIESTVERLAYNVVKLTEALGGLSDLEDSKRLAEGQRRLGDYVR